MFDFDKIFFDRRKMLIRKLSKRKITTSDWFIVHSIIKSFQKSDQHDAVTLLASHTLVDNAIKRNGKGPDLLEAFEWTLDRGGYSIDITRKFLKAANEEYLDKGVDVLLNKNIDKFHLYFVKYYKSIRAKQYEDALSYIEMMYESSFSKDDRRYCANAKRSIFYILQDKISMAWEGRKFLQENPDIVDLGYCLHVASCADAINDKETYSFALKRIFNDSIVMFKNDNLFAAEYVTAFDVLIKLFSLQHVDAVVSKAKRMGLSKWEKLEKRLSQVLTEIQDWRWAVDLAYERIQDIADGNFDVKYDRDENVVVVINSAAFGNNKVDYPGFRSSIRKCYSDIFNACSPIKEKIVVDVNIGKHKHIIYDAPYISYHTIGDLGEGIHFKETDRRYNFSFDLGGYSGWSAFSYKSISELCSQYSNIKNNKKFYNKDYINNISRGESKYSQPNWIEDGLPDKFILVALQLEVDAVHQLSFMTFKEMLSIIETVAKSRNLSVVVKRHPLCKSEELSEYLNELQQKNSIFISRGDIRSLIDMSSGVCVVNSAVGAEALIEKKPVFVFGRSEYMAACYVCNSVEDFSKYIDIMKPKLDDVQFEAFWNAFRNGYSIDVMEESGSERIKNEIINFLNSKLKLGDVCESACKITPTSESFELNS